MKRTLCSTAVAAALAFSGAAFADQGQKQQGQQQQGSQQQSQLQKQGIVTASGEVIGNTTINTSAGDGHQVVKLRSKDHGEVVVDLGTDGPQVQKGDKLFVSGRAARINERPVIFARYAAELQELSPPSGQQGAAAGGTAADDATWGDPSWASDDYGYYDEDFEWTADDSGWNEFFGDADDSWGNYYDDVGDEGLFDV